MFDASPDPSPSTFRAGFFLVHFECDAAQSHFALLLTQALAPLAVQKLIRTSMETHRTALSLYRRCLKLSLDWAVHRHVWRGQAMYIRSLFEQNRRVLDPRQQKALFKETEAILERWKHPESYRPPSAPGGSKYERNIPCPILDPPPPMVL